MPGLDTFAGSMLFLLGLLFLLRYPHQAVKLQHIHSHQVSPGIVDVLFQPDDHSFLLEGDVEGPVDDR